MVTIEFKIARCRRCFLAQYIHINSEGAGARWSLVKQAYRSLGFLKAPFPDVNRRRRTAGADACFICVPVCTEARTPRQDELSTPDDVTRIHRPSNLLQGRTESTWRFCVQSKLPI